MDLSIMDSRSLSTENYIHTSVYTEHFGLLEKVGVNE